VLNIGHICDVYGSPDYDTYLPLLRNNSTVPVKYAANHVDVNKPTSLFSRSTEYCVWQRSLELLSRLAAFDRYKYLLLPSRH